MRIPVVAASLALVVTASCSSGDGDDATPRRSATATTTVAPTPSPTPATRYPGEEWEKAGRGDWRSFDADLAADGSECVAVVQDGRLVHDAYWNGGSEHTARPTYSITKSLTSILVGMSADAGLLDVDDSASEQVDAWRGSAATEAIRVRDLLSMTSGRHWDEPTDDRMIRSEADKTAFAERLAQDRAPGDEWVYDNAATQTLESVLDDVLETDDVVEIAEDHLLDPLGMRDTRWGRDAAGNALTYSGVDSTCLDLARVGHLMLNQGRWRGEQLVSTEFVEQATRPSSELNAAYGQLWWVNAEGRVVEVLRQAGFAQDKAPYRGRLAPDVPDDAFWAFGYGNQYVAVVPSEGVVAVRLGRRPASPDRVTFDSFTSGVLDVLR